jgi:four helix bundle protein
MTVEGLNRLEVWKKGKDFALKINRDVLRLLPPEEKWALCSQLRRSSQSIPSNLAEGYGRFYYQDNIRFCYNARGSLEETLSHIVLAYEMNYLPIDLYNELTRDGESVYRLINGYIGYLKQSKRGAHEPGVDRINIELPESSSPNQADEQPSS